MNKYYAYIIRILKKQKSIAIEYLKAGLCDKKITILRPFLNPTFICGNYVVCEHCILIFLQCSKLKSTVWRGFFQL